MSRSRNSRIKIGIRMHDMPSGTIEERIAMAGKCGYSCAHVALSKLIGEYSVADGALTPGFAMYLKGLFAENHVDIAVLGCYLNLATPDQEEWESSFCQYKAQLRFASLLGCGVVGTETGAPNKEYRPVPECRSEEAFQILLHRLRKVVDCAEGVGAILAIEPVVRHIIYDAERAKRLLEEIKSPNLQIIFDPVNLLDSSNYQEREEIFDLFLETLGKDIAVIHLKDFKVEGGELKFCAPGLGEMDYQKILSYLKKEKPYIHTIMEETLPENAEAAMKYLYEVYDKEFNFPTSRTGVDI